MRNACSILVLVVTQFIMPEAVCAQGFGPEPFRFKKLQSRAVTQENPTGGKGLHPGLFLWT